MAIVCFKEHNWSLSKEMLSKEMQAGLLATFLEITFFYTFRLLHLFLRIKAEQISQTYKKQQNWFNCHNYHFDLDSGDDTNDVDDVSTVAVAADDDEDMVGWWWWCTSWGSRSPCSIFQAHQCSPSSIPSPKPLENVFVYLAVSNSSICSLVTHTLTGY